MFEDIRILWKNTFLYGIGYGFTQLGNFLLLPLFARYLTIEEFGIMALLLVFCSIVGIVQELGIRIALTRFYFDFKEERLKRDIIGTSLIMMHLSSVLILAILLPASEFLSYVVLETKEYGHLFILAILSLYFDAFFNFHLTFLRIKDRPRQFIVQSLFKMFLFLSVTFFLVVSKTRALAGVFEARLIVALATFLVSHILILKETPIRFNKYFVCDLLKFGLPFVPANILSFILTSSDRYLLRLFGSLQEVGLYAMGYKVGTIVNILIAQPFNLAWPQQIKPISEKSDGDKIFTKVLTYYFFVSGFVVLVLLIFLDEIFAILLNPEFEASKGIVFLICISYLLNGSYNILIVGLFLNKKTKYQPIIYGIAAILNLCLNLFFIPKYGMYGAAFTTLLCYALIPILTHLFAKKYYHFRVEYLRILVFFLSIFVVYLLGKSIDFDSIVYTILLKSSILVLFTTISCFSFSLKAKKKLKAWFVSWRNNV
ncbi:MAG: oligosaccharide flippase family protein [Thermodesulfobacteriota bacterium]|nr:oligosaccharide flippase family protein [Thermodesulfobacteriota bacterium]